MHPVVCDGWGLGGALFMGKRVIFEFEFVLEIVRVVNIETNMRGSSRLSNLNYCLG